MNKKILVLVMGLVVIGVGWLLFGGRNTELTDQEIRNKFDCDRVTTDYRSTDLYCNETDLYRQHLKEDKVIED